MNIYRDAVVLMPTQEEHDKFAAFLEANSDIIWNGGGSLESMSFAGDSKAYEITNGRVLHGGIGFFKNCARDYQRAIENSLFLVTVDEYIARCIGWDDVETEIDFDFGDLL